MTSLPESGELRSVATRIGQVGELSFGALAIVTPSEALYGMLRIFAVFSEPYFAAARGCGARAAPAAWLETVTARPDTGG
jgi:hypothetical protein